MQYQSTRNKDVLVTSSVAIKTGLAGDGGLFVPVDIPKLTLDDIAQLAPLTYNERAEKILGYFLTVHITKQNLKQWRLLRCIN